MLGDGRPGRQPGCWTVALDRSFFPDGRYRSNFLVNLGHGVPSTLRPRGPQLAFEAVATIE
jgi:3-hydroxypropanoate dehydrogenase